MNILHVDSRQKLYHTEFGDIPTDVPAERLFTYTDIIEPIGGVSCTAISDVKVAGSQTGQMYDYNDLFDKTPHGAGGAYPPDTFGAMVKNGLLRFGTVIRDTLWKSYWRADIGKGERFDNTIAAMNHANSACTAWSYWYPNWTSLTPLEVMPQGVGTPSEHDWVIKGWQVVNGVTMMVIDGHLGRVNLMPREVFNVEIGRSGCGTGIPATVAIDAISRRSLTEYIIDLCQNAILLLRQLQLFGTFPPTSTDLAWDTRGNASHSVRVLCDEAGLILQEKNILWACVKQESNFLTNPTPNQNFDKHGTVWSTDYGIVQVNDYYHIGAGKEFPSVQYVIDNPEACVRWMIDMYKAGHLSMWSSFSTGAYKQWLPYVPIP